MGRLVLLEAGKKGGRPLFPHDAALQGPAVDLSGSDIIGETLRAVEKHGLAVFPGWKKVKTDGI